MYLLFPSMTVYIDPSRCPLKIYSDPVRLLGDVRVRTGDTVYKAGCHGSARFLASLGRPGMYGATGPCPLDDALMRFDEVHEIRLKRGCKFDLFV